MKSPSEYYNHDQDESLDTMTIIPSPAPLKTMRSVSTPSCPQSATSSIQPLSSTAVSRTVSRDSQHTQDASCSSRIPRRVKSDLNWGAVLADNHSKRSGYTSCSSVTSCLLTSATPSGFGDGSSVDPEVDLWLEMIPLAKRPRNFHRDFSDGVLMAEIMAHFFPKKVDLHNYVPASATSNKKANWQTLNQKVFSKLLGIKLTDSLIENITLSKPGAIEKALKQIHRLVENFDREQVEIRARELSGLAGSFKGTASSLEAPFVEEPCLVRNTPGEIPDCVIYQNIRYFPSTIFDEISKTEEQLREKNNELCSKVRRLETLLSLKESHLQDLTSKIHELREKYESFQIPSGRSDFPNEEPN